MSGGGLYFFNKLPELYEMLRKAGRENEARTIIRNFLIEGFNQDLEQKIDRFRETGISFISADKPYFGLYHELVQLYTNGLFYSTIVMSGVLCERICYDILSKQKIKLDERALSDEQISCLFKMGLAYIFELLDKWGLLREKDTLKKMWEINDKRNEYVHPTKADHDSKADSLEMIRKIAKILENEFGVNPQPEGSLALLKS